MIETAAVVEALRKLTDGYQPGTPISRAYDAAMRRLEAACEKYLAAVKP